MQHIENREIDNNNYNAEVRKEKIFIISCQGGQCLLKIQEESNSRSHVIMQWMYH